DPRVVEDACPIDVVTYTETCNLAYQGAKVIHPRAVEIAMHAEIPLRIRSTYTDDVGTLITSSRGKEKGIDIPDRLVTGIAQIDVKIDNQDIEKQALVFEKMAEADISVDFINVSLSNVIYTVSNDDLGEAIRLLKEEGLELTVTENCAKVSAVGAGMAGIP